MSYYKKHKKGILGTIIYHVIILILLIIFGFFTPLPLPGEEGILVNFGTSDRGLGDIEPSPRRNEPAPVQSQPERQQEKSIPPPQTTQPKAAPTQTSKPEPAKEVAMTQDYEQTAAIEAAEKKKREDEAKRQQQIEEERRKQAEQDRIKQQEIERQRLAELERKRQEEAERIRKEQEQRKINEINSRAQGAFSNSGSGTGGQGSGTGTSQGVTFPGGNQGVPTGDPNAGTYGPGGSGSGNQGTGPSVSLSGRTAKSLPRPRYPGNDEGTVVVKITVDKNGKVTNAEPGVQGTTIMNQQFWNEAKAAALKASFNVDSNAPAFQQGTITYKFVLD